MGKSLLYQRCLFFEVNMPFIKIKGPKPQQAADGLHKLGLHATPPA